jgi:hypothetical protein
VSEMSMDYNHETGELSITTGHFREVIEVRQQLVNAMLRQAIIVELEKLGYTVTPPTKET